MGITLKAVLVKVYNSIRIVELYYSLVQRTYYIIIVKIKGIEKDIAL